MLGETLSVLVDLLNPQAIILGGVYMRSHHLLEEEMYRVMEAEALSVSAKVCQILPSALGEQIGDFAALSLAAYHAE
ncbi:MAG: ROK family protein [Ruminococcaceae bacterium]|nr:ROK family protein [Oscillospiraceae bacterium]